MRSAFRPRGSEDARAVVGRSARFAVSGARHVGQSPGDQRCSMIWLSGHLVIWSLARFARFEMTKSGPDDRNSYSRWRQAQGRDVGAGTTSLLMSSFNSFPGLSKGPSSAGRPPCRRSLDCGLSRFPRRPEAAEPAQLDLLAAMQRVDDALEHRVDDDLGMLLRQVGTRDTSSTSSALVMLPLVIAATHRGSRLAARGSKHRVPESRIESR
jgi:hypothetical protein